jgi:hypothetical protein
VAWQFDESPGFVLEVSLSAHADVEALARSHGVSYTAPVGYTIAEPRVEVRSGNAYVIESATIAELREAWEAPLRDFYGASTGPGPSTGSGPSS